ncbi:MipA/OmpV family protein [Pseudomonas brassicacearum]|uniref:MipA/OmpV family protein n=1 Tax=Pseudomonas brassicacearum TaxID=930166 RepID=UPI003CE8058A
MIKIKHSTNNGKYSVRESSRRWACIHPVLLENSMPLRLAVSTIPSVFLLAVAISAMAAQAAESDNAEPSSSWGLGVGALSSQQPYTGIDRDNKAIPLIYFENEYLWVFGPNAEVKLSQLEIGDTQQIDFSLMGQYDFSGYDADDARVFDGMSDRKSSFWAGAKVEWHTGLVDVRAEWLSEVSGNSKGQRFNVGLERTWRVGEHITLTPQVTAMWQDKKYVDYYFGVRDSEARIDRAAYDGKSALNTEFGVRGNYMFDKHHALFLDIKATSLANEIKDSPLVDSSTENSALFGYLYRF